MKTALVITTYQRPEYLRRLLESLVHADLTLIDSIFFVDDCSSSVETKELINSFSAPGKNILRIFKSVNEGIKKSLLLAYEVAFPEHDIVINIDGDALVRNDFVRRLLDLKSIFRNLAVSGFNTTVENRNPIVEEHERYFLKTYASGINMCIDKQQYEKYIKPGLLTSGNWDFEASKLMKSNGLPTAITKPSVVQHIGLVSAMGHAINEKPDIAEDFYLHELPNVTLIGVSSNDFFGLQKAADISSKYIKFGAVKLLTSLSTNDHRAIRIDAIDCKIDYNRFVLKQLVDFVDTPFFIIFQPDGYLLNPYAWSDEFYNYDYIGANWNWYSDGMQCGNGGFSFRSRRLHEILRDDPTIISRNDYLISNCEEDHNICRIYRPYLESKYEIKFAPKEVCDKFSIENYRVKAPHNKYNGSLGFHGWNNDFSDARLEFIPTKNIF